MSEKSESNRLKDLLSDDKIIKEAQTIEIIDHCKTLYKDNLKLQGELVKERIKKDKKSFFLDSYGDLKSTNIFFIGLILAVVIPVIFLILSIFLNSSTGEYYLSVCNNGNGQSVREKIEWGNDSYRTECFETSEDAYKAMEKLIELEKLQK